VTGGMILIGVVNVALGLWLYSRRPSSAPPVYAHPFVDAGPSDAGVAGLDATPR